MASSRALKLASVVVLMVMVIVVTAPPPQAEACGQVVRKFAPCFTYLRTGGQVPRLCCAGIKKLYDPASSTKDRQDICKCLKLAYRGVIGINLGLASSLPKDCGVDISYEISPSTDCTKVQ